MRTHAAPCADSYAAARFRSESSAKSQQLSEEQRIVHVLNRLGFGARPGDVERVKAMGLENYINQQLSPEKITDTVAENKVKDLAVLNMTTAELYEKYPQPGQLLRQLQARGKLPAELAEARENRVKGNQTTISAAEMPAAEMPAQPRTTTTTAATGESAREQEISQAPEDYYRENGLQQPQRIVAELQASRILRAVYSERQLQEVMVDFWTNHFNVFAGKGADRWLLPAYDRDTIRPNAMSKFSTALARRRARRCSFISTTFRALVQTQIPALKCDREPGRSLEMRRRRSDRRAVSTKITRAS